MTTTIKRHLKPLLAAAAIMATAAAGQWVPFGQSAWDAGLKATLIAVASLAAGYLAAVATRD